METVLDTYQQVVHSNATITTSGSSVVAMNFGHKEVSLVVNVTVAPTGTTPSITYTIQEVDPGNGTTTISAAKSGAAITGLGTQIITLPVMYGGDVIVSWVVTGTSPSFTGVYATLVNKGPSPAIYDQAGNGPVAVKAASTAVAAADPSIAVGLSPNSPLPAGSNALGSVSVTGTTTISGTVTANQGTAAALAGAWPVEVTDGTHTLPTMDVAARKAFVALTDGTNTTAVKAASTAAAATDPSAVVALSPNSPLPAGSNTIGALTANQSVNLAQVGGGATSTAASGVLKVGVVGNAGATTDATLAAGTAPTDGYGTLAQYNTSLPAPTNTQTVSLQSDQSGNLLGFPGAQTKTGAAWNSSTAINTLQYPTGTTTVGAPLGAAAVIVQLDQTTTLTGGAVTFQGTYDGINWVTIPTGQLQNPQTFAQLTNPYTFVASTQQAFLIVVQGFQQVRLNLTTVITGTGSVTPYWTLLSVSPGGATTVVQGMAPAGNAPVGNPLLQGVVAPSGNVESVIGGSDGEMGVAIMGNDSSVHSNSTITASGSTIITKSFYGVQQINLIVNVTAAPTGTTPTITYTIQEIDPGNGTTTMGNSSSTSSITGTGVYTASLNTSTSSAIKVSWTVTGTTPSFTGVYATVVSKATPASQTITTTSTTSTPGISTGYITTSARTNVQLNASTYNEQSANFTGSVSSGSASDASAGTGARTITISWMNSTGTTTGTESATMNGTTAVNLVTTTKCFIEKIVVATVGSTGSNVGAITLFTGSAGAGTAVAIINATDNQTYLSHHYVVSGKTCHVTDMTGTTNSSNQSSFTLTAVSIPVAGLPVLQVSDWVTGSQTFQLQRTYDQQILVVGPARLQMFVAPGATATILSQGAFDYYDQ